MVLHNPVLHIPATAIAWQLLLWAVIWMAAGLLGLWITRSERWRAFWFVSGIWCVVDAVIALSGLVTKPAELSALRRILFINAGLDVVYLAVGLALLLRATPTRWGAGLAVIIQAAFLFGFDLFHGLRLPPA